MSKYHTIIVLKDKEKSHVKSKILCNTRLWATTSQHVGQVVSPFELKELNCCSNHLATATKVFVIVVIEEVR